MREVLQLRGELAKSSVKKYEAMQHVTGRDGRGRGFLQFYGAGRTGRFAGCLVQVQNLPRNYLPDLAEARDLVRTGNFEALELLYDSVPDTLSQLIRTAFIPADGHRFVVADFSAIEARVIAWLAGETTTLRAFRDGKDLYCETASRMFGVPIDKHITSFACFVVECAHGVPISGQSIVVIALEITLGLNRVFNVHPALLQQFNLLRVCLKRFSQSQLCTCWVNQRPALDSRENG